MIIILQLSWVAQTLSYLTNRYFLCSKSSMTKWVVIVNKLIYSHNDSYPLKSYRANLANFNILYYFVFRRWLPRHFFRIACITRLLLDVTYHLLNYYLVDWWWNVNFYLFVWWFMVRFLLQQFDIGNRWIPTHSNYHSWVTNDVVQKCIQTSKMVR